MKHFATIQKDFVRVASGFFDKLKGGLADGKSLTEFEPEQIEQGTKIEMEHTKDSDLATEIAMDHLSEHSTYYEALKHMEDELEAEKQ